jgi:DNA-binding CsgD family transcriptional regulator
MVETSLEASCYALSDLEPNWFPHFDTTESANRFFEDLCADYGLLSVSAFAETDARRAPRWTLLHSTISDGVAASVVAGVERSAQDQLAALGATCNRFLRMKMSFEETTLGDALTFCFKDKDGTRILLVFTSLSEMTKSIISELIAVARAIEDLSLVRILQQRPAAGAKSRLQVSERERDCLYWTAEGKTSDEIAIILGLSTHTVNHYLTSATRKLDAANRTHAVTRAIRFGLINQYAPG